MCIRIFYMESCSSNKQTNTLIQEYRGLGVVPGTGGEVGWGGLGVRVRDVFRALEAQRGSQ